jgi:ABC-type sugar transport system ATPase subunit
MSTAPALAIRGLSKTFTRQCALADVEMTIQPGEIRALVGQNGCGKSTLIKVLAGYHDPDEGAEVHVGGERLPLGQAGAGDHAGPRFVHQYLGLVPTLDTRDHLAFGHGYERNRFGLISWAKGLQLAGAESYVTDLFNGAALIIAVALTEKSSRRRDPYQSLNRATLSSFRSSDPTCRKVFEHANVLHSLHRCRGIRTGCCRPRRRAHPGGRWFARPARDVEVLVRGRSRQAGHRSAR